MEMNAVEANKSLRHDMIPDEILFEIVSRLPVRSVCRFRCVSKLWNSTTYIPCFIKSHLDKCPEHDTGATALIVAFPDDHTLTCHNDYVDRYKNDDDPSTNDILVVAGNVISESLNGLICIKKNFNSLRVANPSTRELVSIPDIQKHSRSWRKDHFGYDPINHRYKILSELLIYIRPNKGFLMQKYVFVIGGHSWTRLPDNDLLYVPCGQSVCMKGIVYYMALVHPIRTDVVIAFDVRLETFRSILVPTKIGSFNNIHVMRFDDHFALTAYDPFYHKNKMDIWILEDSVDPNWIRKHIVFSSLWTNIITGYKLWYVAGNFQNGEIIVASFDQNKPFSLFCLNLKLATHRRVEISCLKDQVYSYCCQQDSIYATRHLETLVSCMSD